MCISSDVAETQPKEKAEGVKPPTDRLLMIAPPRVRASVVLDNCAVSGAVGSIKANKQRKKKGRRKKHEEAFGKKSAPRTGGGAPGP